MRKQANTTGAHAVEYKVGFTGNFGGQQVSPRALLAHMLGRLVCVEGIVTKLSLVRPKLVKTVHHCEATGQVRQVDMLDLTNKMRKSFPSQPTITYIHTHIYTCMHTYIHIYIHAYIHAYIHTYINVMARASTYCALHNQPNAISLTRTYNLSSVSFPTPPQSMHREYRDAYSMDGFPTPAAMPKVDDEGNPLQIEFGLSTFRDFQSMHIQEMPERAPLGQLPRSIEVVLEQDLVDSIKPGDRIKVVGIYRAIVFGLGAGFKTVLFANSTSSLGKDISSLVMTPSDLKVCMYVCMYVCM
jgi:DNA replicative helicase MCM subunit Mcm2 (Cdc46/Mcm family)